MRFVVFIFIALLSACAGTMPNDISQSKSNFDGSDNYWMQPGFIYENANTSSWASFQLGLFWSSKFKDSLIIKAKIPNQIIGIKSTAGLQFNIDNKIIKLSAPRIASIVNVDTVANRLYVDSTQDFSASINLLNSLINAESVKVKLITIDGYLDGDLKADKPGAAIRGFIEFSHKIKKS